MNLTKGQAEAVEMVGRLIKDKSLGILTGYAGTGKTFLFRVLADMYGAPKVLAPTGKAASRVTEATGLQASTIHRWIYSPEEFLGNVRFNLKTDVEPPERLVIIDEASMVPEDVFRDVRKICEAKGAALLLVGDSFQLPPVSASASPLLHPAPHRVNMTEIQRQALDSPIIRASMKVRESAAGVAEAMGELRSVPPSKLVEEAADVVHRRCGTLLVHKNESRRLMNARLRRAGNLPDNEVLPGEPLLVLFNNYRAEKFNGEIASFGGWSGEWFGDEVRDDFADPPVALDMTFGRADVEGVSVMLSPEEVRGEAAALSVRRIFAKGCRFAEEGFPYMPKDERPKGHLNANFGYALTVHKAQGSEWDDVVVVLENSVKWTTYEGRRWTYTALTRARKSVKLCVEPDLAAL